MNFQSVSYGPDKRQNFDILFCENCNPHAIIYIHGGAYFTGNKYQYPSFLLNYTGSNIFATIDYRVLEENNDIHMEDILSDVDGAISKIVELSNLNGVDIKDLILIGHSAGGHIGLLYGYKYPQKIKKISTCISLAGPTDFTDDIAWSSMAMWGSNLKERLSFLSLMGSRLTGHIFELNQKNWTKQENYYVFQNHIMDISPITYISKNNFIPPTLLVHARGDNQVPYSNSVRLMNKLDSTSVPHKLITPGRSGNSHMLGGVVYTDNSPIQFHNQTWVGEARKWMEGYLL